MTGLASSGGAFDSPPDTVRVFGATLSGQRGIASVSVIRDSGASEVLEEIARLT
jgi:hypothetical protein